MAKGTVNKVVLLGRLGQDPDIRYAPSGTAIAKFSLATNERVPAGGGEYKDETEWHKITVFGKTAEFVGNYLTKGKLAYVEGRIRTNQWEDQQGQKRYSTEIIASDIQIVGGGEGNGNGNGGGQSRQQNNSSRSNGGSKQQNSSRRQQSEFDDFPSGGSDELGGFPPDTDIPF